ncbi:MAG: MBL fold metallo-hydrolase, partial [Clostridia bacterium]|nr:MBL fold metallo-hydrolase [Clostridia bacterium]
IGDTLFAGDVLFENGIGRVDLIGSSKNDMIDSLGKLEHISYDKVLSGHGEESNKEKQRKNLTIYKRFLTR